MPEQTDKKSAAFKAGFKTIADICKERIRRAASQIEKENNGHDSDLGFKAFVLDSTNVRRWDGQFSLTAQTLEESVSNIKPDRSDEDVVYEILLKQGHEVTLQMNEHLFGKEKIFEIGMGAIVLCLSSSVTTGLIENIVRLRDNLSPEEMRVVFRDSGFKDDVAKTNAIQILRQRGIEHVKTI